MHTERGETQHRLSEYVEIFRRHKAAIVLFAILVPMVAYVVSQRQSKLFRGESEVLISRQELGSAVTGIPNANAFSEPERFARTQAALARVPEVARRAIAAEDVAGMTPTQFLSRSSVHARTDADLLRFTFDHPDKALASRLATAYAEAFTAYRLETDTTNLARARKELLGQIADLRRRKATDTETYRDLVAKAQDLRTLELLQARASVVRPATGAEQIRPTPVRNAALGAAVGIILGFGIALLWNALDRRVRSEEEIERVLGVPLLARLPRPPRRLKNEGLAMLDDPAHVSAEAVRRLRTNLELAMLTHAHSAILVTSAAPAEGKSTTIANLAIALARAGRNVTLVDLDLRQPFLGTLFGIEERPGITDAVLGRVSLDEALAPIRLSVPGRSTGDAFVTAMGRLQVLPSGSTPANPGEFVGTQALALLIAELRRDNDIVLIDSPPILAVGDAMSLSTQVDAILLVVRPGVTNRPMLRDLGRAIAVSPAVKLGFVLTGVDEREAYGASAYAEYARRNESKAESVRETAAPLRRMRASGS